MIWTILGILAMIYLINFLLIRFLLWREYVDGNVFPNGGLRECFWFFVFSPVGIIPMFILSIISFVAMLGKIDVDKISSKYLDPARRHKENDRIEEKLG